MILRSIVQSKTINTIYICYKQHVKGSTRATCYQYVFVSACHVYFNIWSFRNDIYAKQRNNGNSVHMSCISRFLFSLLTNTCQWPYLLTYSFTSALELASLLNMNTFFMRATIKETPAVVRNSISKHRTM